MKRFVVIITSLLIIFVFIALNYLLWDRESLVTLGESNQASIEALSRMNMTLNQDKSRMEQQAEELKRQIGTLEDKIGNLEKDILEHKLVINEKTKSILNMKAQINPLPVKAITLDWIGSLAEKEYPQAFLAGGSNCSFWGNYWSMRIFSDYFEQNVEQLQLVLDGEKSQPHIEVVPIKTPDWEMSVYVRVYVTLKEAARQDFLKQGENILHLTYTYSERLEQWMITSVYSEEAATEEKAPQEDNTVTVQE